MIAAKLISKILAPLKPDDTGEDSLTIMNIYHVKHLPIVRDSELLAVISEDEILSNDLELTIGSYQLIRSSHFVHQNDHLFEVMSKMGEMNWSTIPVLDEEENYMGMITMEELLQFYANSFSFKEPGSIIVLETSRLNYSLAEISRIIETENAQILSSFLTTEKDSNQVLVTIKLNIHEVHHIIATLERYDYNVTATFSEDEYFHGLKERYDALMRYLSV